MEHTITDIEYDEELYSVTLGELHTQYSEDGIDIDVAIPANFTLLSVERYDYVSDMYEPVQLNDIDMVTITILAMRKFKQEQTDND